MLEPSDSPSRSLSQFLQHEATRIITTPPTWDAGPSQGYPSESKVFCPRTQHSNSASSQLEPGRFDPKFSALTARPARLRTWCTRNIKIPEIIANHNILTSSSILNPSSISPSFSVAFYMTKRHKFTVALKYDTTSLLKRGICKKK